MTPYILIVLIWAGNGGGNEDASHYDLSMQEFTSRTSCEAAALRHNKDERIKNLGQQIYDICEATFPPKDPNAPVAESVLSNPTAEGGSK